MNRSCTQINIDKMKIGVVLHKSVTGLRPLIDLRISFLRNG